MKTLCPSYTLSGADLTLVVDFPLTLESVLLITDVENNDILYNFADPSRGGSLTGNVLTLDYVGSAADGTALQIFLDDGKAAASNETLEALTAAIAVLQRIAKNLESLQVVDANQRQRVTLDSITGSLTLAAVTGVTTVTSLNQLGGVSTNFLFTDIARQAFTTGIRQNLTF